MSSASSGDVSLMGASFHLAYEREKSLTKVLGRHRDHSENVYTHGL